VTLAPGTKLGPYEILAPIGAGGMGEVYRARDPRVGRDVAIKVSSEQFSDRFTREIHAVAALNHSNVCTLYDVGPNYLVMELVEGPTLADRIKQGPIPLDESLEIARQIADAMEGAHEKGIVHRDLKPGNIKIRPDGTVKVLDFGLAKVEVAAAVSLETSPTLSVAQTAVGVLLGTAAYMSPEQARGKAVDKRADIWAFGVVLYEMLTGQQLFSGETVSDTLAEVLKKEADWEKVPAKVRPLLRRCLEKDPKKRLRDIGDASPLLDGLPESIPAKQSWLAWSVASILFILLATIAVVHFLEKPPAAAKPMRFQFALPDKVNMATGSSFSLSPDGRHLAFGGVDSNNITRLWIRSLDSLEARPLIGTESSHIPPFFWSSDSRYVAFDAGGKLKKVDIFGGQPQTICDLSAYAMGGAWNREGMIILATWGKGLMQVSASDGAASPLFQLNPARRDTGHYFPTFLPDGRHFLYYCISAISENHGGYVCSLDSNPEAQGSKLVLKTDYFFTYAPSQDDGQGYLLFLKEQTVMAQKFDEKRLALVGDPIPVAEQVGSFANYPFFSVSQNGVLVYRSSGANQLSRISWYDRQGHITGSMEDTGNYGGLTFSSNGLQLAYSRWDTQAQTGSDVYLFDLSRGMNTRFTFGKGDNNHPVWSPAADLIIFASDRDGGIRNLYEKTASGTREEELLLKSDENKVPNSWSRDGRFLLYTAENAKTKNDLWVLPMDADRKGIPLLRTEFNEFDGLFSPDMRWIAYISDESGSNEVFVRPFRQGKSPEMGDKIQISKGGGTGVRWSRDGKELYYRGPNGKVMAVEVTAGTVFQAGTSKLLFQAPPDISSEPFRPTWDVTGDGNRFLQPVPTAEWIGISNCLFDCESSRAGA
jgi:eukaryotic-like serine/threonine-protein kinase